MLNNSVIKREVDKIKLLCSELDNKITMLEERNQQNKPGFPFATHHVNLNKEPIRIELSNYEKGHGYYKGQLRVLLYDSLISIDKQGNITDKVPIELDVEGGVAIYCFEDMVVITDGRNGRWYYTEDCHSLNMMLAPSYFIGYMNSTFYMADNNKIHKTTDYGKSWVEVCDIYDNGGSGPGMVFNNKLYYISTPEVGDMYDNYVFIISKDNVVVKTIHGIYLYTLVRYDNSVYSFGIIAGEEEDMDFTIELVNILTDERYSISKDVDYQFTTGNVFFGYSLTEFVVYSYDLKNTVPCDLSIVTSYEQSTEQRMLAYYERGDERDILYLYPEWV